jgi:hypothetical protein
MLSAIERVLKGVGSKVGKLKGMPVGEAIEAGKQGLMGAGRSAVGMAKANPKGAAVLGGAAGLAGFGAGRASVDDSDDERKRRILAMLEQGG